MKDSAVTTIVTIIALAIASVVGYALYLSAPAGARASEFKIACVEAGGTFIDEVGCINAGGEVKETP